MAGAVGTLEVGVEQPRFQKRDLPPQQASLPDLGHPAGDPGAPQDDSDLWAEDGGRGGVSGTDSRATAPPERANSPGTPAARDTPRDETAKGWATRFEGKTGRRPWGRMEQAMRAADLLLQAGGFGAVVIDMGSLKPEFCSRVPLATWFRYRAAAERTRTSVVLLTQVACAKSSAEVVLRMEAEEILAEPTVFAGLRPRVELVRQRFSETGEGLCRGARNEEGEERGRNVVSIRKPPRRETGASWESRTVVGRVVSS